MTDDLCAVCGRPPHAVDDPECMNPTKPIALQLAWALKEIALLRAALANAALPRADESRHTPKGKKP